MFPQFDGHLHHTFSLSTTHVRVNLQPCLISGGAFLPTLQLSHAKQTAGEPYVEHAPALPFAGVAHLASSAMSAKNAIGRSNPFHDATGSQATRRWNAPTPLKKSSVAETQRNGQTVLETDSCPRHITFVNEVVERRRHHFCLSAALQTSLLRTRVMEPLLPRQHDNTSLANSGRDNGMQHVQLV